MKLRALRSQSHTWERGFKFIQRVQSNILAIYDGLGIVSNKVKVMALSAVKGRGHIFATWDRSRACMIGETSIDFDIGALSAKVNKSVLRIYASPKGKKDCSILSTIIEQLKWYTAVQVLHMFVIILQGNPLNGSVVWTGLNKWTNSNRQIKPLSSVPLRGLSLYREISHLWRVE